MQASASVHGLQNSLCLSTLLLCAVTAPAFAQDPGKTPPTEGSPSIQTGGDANGPPGQSTVGRMLVGDSAPDVDMNDQYGKRFHLSDARKEKPWLLVFAPRPQDAVTAEGALPGLDELGTGLIVIAPFPHNRVTRLVPNARARFLVDRSSRVARVYGVFDAVTTSARSGVFLVDKRGRVLLTMSGGMPSNVELVRLTKEALEAAGQRPRSAPESLSSD
jgi:peroxiredoxin